MCKAKSNTSTCELFKMQLLKATHYYKAVLVIVQITTHCGQMEFNRNSRKYFNMSHSDIAVHTTLVRQPTQSLSLGSQTVYFDVINGANNKISKDSGAVIIIV